MTRAEEMRSWTILLGEAVSGRFEKQLVEETILLTSKQNSCVRASSPQCYFWISLSSTAVSLGATSIP